MRVYRAKSIDEGLQAHEVGTDAAFVIDLDADTEARTLIRAAATRELKQRSGPIDTSTIEEDRQVRLALEALTELDRDQAMEAAETLLTWLDRRAEERTGGDG